MEHSRFKIPFQIPEFIDSLINQSFDFSLKMDVQKSAEQWKKQGNEAFKNKDYQKAVQYYSHAIKCDPKDHSFYSNRAICYYNLNMFHQCIEDCDSCINIKKNFSKAFRRKGLALVQLLRFGEAIATYKQVMAFDKDLTIRNELQDAESIESNYSRYLKAIEKQQYAEALSCINYVASKIQSNDQLRMFKVECMAKMGDTAGALTLLKTIPSATAQHPDYWYLKGIIELYGGDSGRAKKFFMEGMRLDPDNNKCRLALNKSKNCERLKEQGNQAIKKADYPQAEAKYTQALNLDPFNKKLNAVIYSNRALTYMKRKDNMKALDDLNKSLQLDPEYSKSLIRRAQIQMQRGQYTAAIMDYNKIQEIDPSANMKAKIKDAQKKQKDAKKKDYYKILGIQKNVGDPEIKKAYKALALKYHPDRNRSKSQAEQDQASKMFKEVAQAYGVLSDPKKKQLYDSGQMDYDGDQTGGFGGFGGGGADPNDIFRMFFGGGGGMGGMGGGMGGFGGMGGMGGGGGNQKYTFRFG